MASFHLQIHCDAKVSLRQFTGRGNSKSTADPKVRSTVLRDGNFDYVTGEVRWDRTARPLPASLYLTEKPAFFGDEPWPWVDPTGQRKLGTLPAKRLVGQPPTPGQ